MLTLHVPSPTVASYAKGDYMYVIIALSDVRSDWQNKHKRIMDFKSENNVSIVRLLDLSLRIEW